MAVAGRLSIELTPATLKMIRRLDVLWGRARLYNEIERFFGQQGLKIAGYITRTKVSGQRLAIRTGRLAGSIVGSAVRVDGVPAVRVGVLRGPALAYVRIQELGGIVKKKPGGPNLAIPQPLVLTPAGVDRFGGPRGYPGELKFIPFRNSGVAVGGLFPKTELERIRKRGLDLENARMAYLLVTRVRIPAKHFMRDGFKESLPGLARELAVFVKTSLNKTIEREEDEAEGETA